MFNRLSQSDYRTRFRRKRVFSTAALVIFAVFLVFLAFILFIRLSDSGKTDREALQALWESEAFEKTYAESRERLKQTPLDFFLLTLRGFSAYQLAVAQINTFDTINYLNDCIWSLRKALLLGEGQTDGRLFYVLGKAYYDKGPEYADLAVNYLEKARKLDFEARDIPQYLGLAYAAIRDYRSSVMAFTMALNPYENEAGEFWSDSLLLAIANSYLALGETDLAQGYLYRCVETSRDSKSITAARLLLGGIMSAKGDSDGAETQYRMILSESGENADAHFYLGELYAAAGDSTRARAEWRTAVRVDPAHRPARIRLNG